MCTVISRKSRLRSCWNPIFTSDACTELQGDCQVQQDEFCEAVKQQVGKLCRMAWHGMAEELTE